MNNDIKEILKIKDDMIFELIEKNKELEYIIGIMKQFIKDRLVYYSDGTYAIPTGLDYEEVKEIIELSNNAKKLERRR